MKKDIDSNTGDRVIDSKPEFTQRKVELDETAKLSKVQEAALKEISLRNLRDDIDVQTGLEPEDTKEIQDRKQHLSTLEFNARDRTFLEFDDKGRSLKTVKQSKEETQDEMQHKHPNDLTQSGKYDLMLAGTPSLNLHNLNSKIGNGDKITAMASLNKDLIYFGTELGKIYKFKDPCNAYASRELICDYHGSFGIVDMILDTHSNRIFFLDTTLFLKVLFLPKESMSITRQREYIKNNPVRTISKCLKMAEDIMDLKPFLKMSNYHNSVYFKNSDTTIEVFDSNLEKLEQTSAYLDCTFTDEFEKKSKALNKSHRN